MFDPATAPGSYRKGAVAMIIGSSAVTADAVGTVLALTALISWALSWMRPARFSFGTDHKPGDVLEKDDGMTVWVRINHEPSSHDGWLARMDDLTLIAEPDEVSGFI